MRSEELRTHVFAATALAGAAHLVLDAVTSRTPFTTPPYLLLDHASEAFRDLLALDRTTILLAVAFISAGVNGAIAALFGAAVESSRRPVLVLGGSLSALWVLSGALMTFVYLDPPGIIVAGSLLAGVPRAFVVAWVLVRAFRREAPGDAA